MLGKGQTAKIQHTISPLSELSESEDPHIHILDLMRLLIYQHLECSNCAVHKTKSTTYGKFDILLVVHWTLLGISVINFRISRFPSKSNIKSCVKNMAMVYSFKMLSDFALSLFTAHTVSHKLLRLSLMVTDYPPIQKRYNERKMMELCSNMFTGENLTC
jgi:hypothetical protein